MLFLNKPLFNYIEFCFWGLLTFQIKNFQLATPLDWGTLQGQLANLVCSDRQLATTNDRPQTIC